MRTTCKHPDQTLIKFLRASPSLAAPAGRLEVLAAARAVLHEVPASDPSAHITSCALYADSSKWLAVATGTQSDVFCVTTSASGLLQVNQASRRCNQTPQSLHSLDLKKCRV